MVKKLAKLEYFSNNFKGNANSPVAYQMMQGLQDGTNFTWSLIAQKKLTKFLDLNLTDLWAIPFQISNGRGGPQY